MRLGKYLTSLNQPELERIKEICNFTDEEEKIFDELAKGRSRVLIAEKYALSCTTVSNRIKHMQNKIEKVT